MVIALILVSCNTSVSTSTTTPASIQTTNVTTPVASITTSTIKPVTTSTSTTTGNWWDSLGIPQYGGTLTLRSNKDVATFDPWISISLNTVQSTWMERLFGDDWTLDPAVFPYNIDYRPSQYVKGLLAQSFEFSDPSTFVVHLRQGIHWQNIAPVNGREFVASDVVFHFDRMLGLGSGMTPSPSYVNNASYTPLISVTATDKYTVVFKWKVSNPEFILETMQALGDELDMEATEAVNAWGNLNDWHHAIGTGPFILSDFVSGASATLSKNPNYWGYDERYPKNQLPYIDTIKMLIIPDSATAIAAFRTGKIDVLDSLTIQQAQQIEKTQPDVLQVTIPAASAETIDPRNDVVPFKDIRVREAMQMAIDLPTLAKTYYAGTCSPDPCTLTSSYMIGWGFPYNIWPQDLKDQYVYNPTAAKKLLADAGYPNGFKTDVVFDQAGDSDLLQIVKSYFAAIGINMEIRPMDSLSWTSFVITQKKYDQMEQRSGGGQFGITYQPLRQIARLLTNSASNHVGVSDPAYDALYNKALAASNLIDVQQAVKDINQYVAQSHFAISLLQTMVPTLYQPWLKGYSGQARALWGGGTGPLMLGTYGARFWIDQNLKKSLGY